MSFRLVPASPSSTDAAASPPIDATAVSATEASRDSRSRAGWQVDTANPLAKAKIPWDEAKLALARALELGASATEHEVQADVYLGALRSVQLRFNLRDDVLGRLIERTTGSCRSQTPARRAALGRVAVDKALRWADLALRVADCTSALNTADDELRYSMLDSLFEFMLEAPPSERLSVACSMAARARASVAEAQAANHGSSPTPLGELIKIYSATLIRLHNFLYFQVCPICEGPVMRPLRLSSCEHVFCLACIHSAVVPGVVALCPVCHEFIPDYMVESIRVSANDAPEPPRYDAVELADREASLALARESMSAGSVSLADDGDGHRGSGSSNSVRMAFFKRAPAGSAYAPLESDDTEVRLPSAPVAPPVAASLPLPAVVAVAAPAVLAPPPAARKPVGQLNQRASPLVPLAAATTSSGDASGAPSVPPRLGAISPGPMATALFASSSAPAAHTSVPTCLTGPTSRSTLASPASALAAAFSSAPLSAPPLVASPTLTSPATLEPSSALPSSKSPSAVAETIASRGGTLDAASAVAAAVEAADAASGTEARLATMAQPTSSDLSATVSLSEPIESSETRDATETCETSLSPPSTRPVMPGLSLAASTAHGPAAPGNAPVSKLQGDTETAPLATNPLPTSPPARSAPTTPSGGFRLAPATSPSGNRPQLAPALGSPIHPASATDAPLDPPQFRIDIGRLPLYTWDGLDVHELLGGGKFSSVSRASDAYGEYAVKVFKSVACEDEVRAFLREAETLVGIMNPYCVRIYGILLDERRESDGVGLVTEYMDGGSLYAVLRKLPPLCSVPYPVDCKRLLAQRILWLHDIARATRYLHESRNILHLDIKTANVLVDANGAHAKLADFGLSCNPSFSRVHGFTRRYAAPEVLDAANDVMFAADVFSFACVAVETLSSSQPFGGGQRPDNHYAPPFDAHTLDSLRALLVNVGVGATAADEFCAVITGSLRGAPLERPRMSTWCAALRSLLDTLSSPRTSLPLL